MAENAGLLERRLAAEQQTLALPLRALARRDPVVCRERDSIRSAIQLMHAHKVGSVVVLGEHGKPVGIFTATDLVAALDLNRESEPIAQVMTAAPFSLPSHAMAYEAALAMMANRIRHVLVVDDGSLVGVVSERDLFPLQRLGLGELTTQIRLAPDIDLLVGLAAEIGKLARLLVEQGVAPEQLTLFVSVLNDRLCQRIIEIERKDFDLEQISWCWLAFGSEGRFEQTFSTDQDNGMLFVSHAGLGPDAVRERMLPFARKVNEALDRCGFPLCKGNVMASNPKLCLSLEEWRAKMAGWIETPDPKAILDAQICFDFRALHGDATLARQLRDWVLPKTRANPIFLRFLAENALHSPPPLGRFLSDFVTEDAPGAPHTINLKLYGVRPFVDAARVFALAHALPETNTGARFRAAQAATGRSAAEAEAIVQAFYVVQGVRLRHQAGLADLTDAVANRVDPDRLNELERAFLKEALRHARSLQRRLEMDYRL
jgi:CBS domain-containing protein